jgi:membrane-associated protein
VLISILPLVIEVVRERRAKKKGDPDAATAIGVVAAASIAGLAESFRDDDDDEPRKPPRSHRAR